MKRSILSCLLSGALFGWWSVQASDAEDFRTFLWRFFNDRGFQTERVQFPVAKESIVFDGEKYNGTKETTISRVQWKHLPGPDQYRCKTNCFDIVIYDNFGQKFRASTERVVAFEGVENGINSALFFQLENGKWVLVRIEDLNN